MWKIGILAATVGAAAREHCAEERPAGQAKAVRQLDMSVKTLSNWLEASRAERPPSSPSWPAARLLSPVPFHRGLIEDTHGLIQGLIEDSG
jgi:hypothetical protein